MSAADQASDHRDLRIAADLRARIKRGEFRPGDALPSITRLAQEYDCAKTTAAKALNVLKREGVARGVQGWGTLVTDKPLAGD